MGDYHELYGFVDSIGKLCAIMCGVFVTATLVIGGIIASVTKILLKR